MPFKPGQSGNPAGKPRGSLNKRRQEIMDRFYASDRDPHRILEVLYDIAVNELDRRYGDQRPISIEDRINAADKLAPYLFIKLKAVQLSTDEGAPVNFVINIQGNNDNQDNKL